MRNIRKLGLPFHQKRSIIIPIVEKSLLERLEVNFMAWQIILTVALLITSALLFYITNKLRKHQ
jgi:hypothetical protein